MPSQPMSLIDGRSLLGNLDYSDLKLLTSIVERRPGSSKVEKLSPLKDPTGYAKDEYDEAEAKARASIQDPDLIKKQEQAARELIEAQKEVEKAREKLKRSRRKNGLSTPAGKLHGAKKIRKAKEEYEKAVDDWHEAIGKRLRAMMKLRASEDPDLRKKADEAYERWIKPLYKALIEEREKKSK
jgi:hypothetical protein